MSSPGTQLLLVHALSLTCKERLQQMWLWPVQCKPPFTARACYCRQPYSYSFSGAAPTVKIIALAAPEIPIAIPCAGLDNWQLIAAEQLTVTCKSMLLMTAVLKGRLDAKQAIDASRLEEDYQLEEWGAVEAGHDLDIADINIRVFSPSLLLQLLKPAA